jgi:MYXO-CTERM domain-containing protein
VGFPGGQVRFINAAGQIMTYTVSSSAVIPTPGLGQPSDLLLGTLSEPIPSTDGIRYFGVADVTAAQAVGLPILAHGQNPAYSPSPHLGTNVIDDVVLAESTRSIQFGWTDGVPGEIYLIGGDSGGPVFVRAHGDLALVGVNYAVSRLTNDPQPGDASFSSFVPEYVDGLNAQMGSFEVTLVPVPEPAGMLAVAGLALAAGVIRRRQLLGRVNRRS